MKLAEECIENPCKFFITDKNSIAEVKKSTAEACCDIREALDKLEEMTSLLEESHMGEHSSDHCGDGPEDCSYCQAIKETKEFLEKFESIN